MLDGLTGIVLFQIMLVVIITIPAFMLAVKNKENILRIGLVGISYAVFFVMRITPGLIGFINVNIPWWVSRVLGIIAGILCCILFGKCFEKNNYFRITQEKTHFGKIIPVALITITAYLVIFYVRGTPQEFNMEMFIGSSVIFGIEEEIIFRGVILGLLMSALEEKIKIVKYPAVILSALFFGLYHGNFQYFDLPNIITNCCYGYVAGWITIKQKSILVPIIMHNIINGFGYAITVIIL